MLSQITRSFRPTKLQFERNQKHSLLSLADFRLMETKRSLPHNHSQAAKPLRFPLQILPFQQIPLANNVCL